MAINTTAIANLLRPGLKAVFGNYPNYPSQWTEIYKKYESDKAVEYEVEMKMLGLAQIRAEGAPTALDTMGQRVITQYVHKYTALGFTITRQAIKDNLYKSKFPLMSEALMKSMAQTKEILGASVLNNGFLATYPIGDGQPLFSTAHPIDNGTVSNTAAVSADLNEASLEDAIVTIQQFKDQSGLIGMTQPKKLLVPPSLQFTAARLLESQFRTQTANNDISATYNMNCIPDGFRVNQYLSSPTTSTTWFVLTDAMDGFKYYSRETIETDVYTDWSTDNVMAKAVERYSFGVSNFRAGYATGN